MSVCVFKLICNLCKEHCALEKFMRDSIISISFFSVVLSVQHPFSLLGDYSHGCLGNASD